MRTKLFVSLPLDAFFFTELGRFIPDNTMMWKRVTPPHQLHLTALNLGVQEESVIPHLQELLGEITASMESFSLAFEGIGYGQQSPQDWRMLQATFKHSAQFEALVFLLARACKPYRMEDSFAEEKIPHITLAEDPTFDTSSIVPPLLSRLRGKSMKVTRLDLMESQRGLYRLSRRWEFIGRELALQARRSS